MFGRAQNTKLANVQNELNFLAEKRRFWRLFDDITFLSPRSQLGRWIIVNLIAHLTVLIVLDVKDLGMLALGVVLTPIFAVCFWYPWILAPAARRPWLIRTVWTLWLTWLFLAARYRGFLGNYPDHGTLEFSLSEPFYTLVLARDRVHLWMLPAITIPVIGGWWLAKGEPGSRVSRVRSRIWPWAGLLVVLVLLVAFDKLDTNPKGMGPDVTSLRMLAEMRTRRIGAGGLRRALAREAAPKGAPPPFHVLLLVHESLNADGMDPALMPAFKGRLDRGEILRFPKAYAAATMTDVALPSLFAGLSPAQPSAIFHRVPLIWHRAQAHDMPTALFSVQRLNYYGFKDYFLADGLDDWTSAERAKLPLVNDTGGEDGTLVARYRTWLQEHRGRRTFTILHFNATHAPYLQMPGFTPWTAPDVARLRPAVLPSRRQDLARYWNAIAYLDHVQEQVMSVLRDERLLDHTWIISTADHGECFDSAARGRMDDLRPQALHVPLWMRLPQGFPGDWRTALETNQTRLTTNLDIVPTLAMALGDSALAGLGSSLLEKVKHSGRVVVAHNSGEIRSRKPETAAMIWEDGSVLSTWRWHSLDGVVYETIQGESGRPVSPPTEEQRAFIRHTLEAFPILTQAGAGPS